jgi:hypothetical protein
VSDPSPGGSATRLSGLAFAVSLVALFRERLVSYLFGPKLDLHFSRHNGADLHLTTATLRDPKTNEILAQMPCWYVRIRVRNGGRSTAEKVELAIVELQRRDPAGRYVKDNTFLPLNLTWSHTGEKFRDRIPPGTTRFCDLLHLAKPDGRYVGEYAQLDLEVHLANYISKLQLNHSYGLVLELAASNLRAKTYHVHLHLPAGWHDEASQLTKAGFYFDGLSEGPS